MTTPEILQLEGGQTHLHFGTIDSTNLEAKRRAADCDAPLWITADEQTAGIGRRGRAWSTAKGNFAGSLLLPVTVPAEQLAEYSFVAALALFDSFVDVTGSADEFTLKWPNDVLRGGAKIAGILLEAVGKPDHLIIGIGVNLRHDAEREKLAVEAMATATLESDLSATEFLAHLAPNFARRADERRASGFAATRAEWLARAAKRNEAITARLPNQEITGKFVDLDANGALLLENETGRHVIAAADIFF